MKSPANQSNYSDIHLFNMFSLNYPYNFIQNVWSGESCHISNHLQSKFMEAYDSSGSRGVMLKFWSELDSNNRQTLENWILENYKG